jgi:putative mRNA 3-end processing factor
LPLLEFTDVGIYCPQADIYIDPWKPVKKALITHGHSDHARWGHQYYMATHEAVPVIRYRLGNINIRGVAYGQSVLINGVKFSFHPAGHIPGSAQIRVEYKGEVWVASGDYKVEDDGLAEAFEPIQCHSFITESTFGLPIFDWKPQEQTIEEINLWWAQNASEGKVSILSAYSLGKAQRIINSVRQDLGTIYTHGAVENTNQVLRDQGYKIAPTTLVIKEHKSSDFDGSLVIAPPSAIGSSWSKRFKTSSVAFASGWMAMRGTRRRRAADRGFVLSDHADWKGLNAAIAATGAENIFVTHGYTDTFTRWLREKGYNAHVISTEYNGEDLDSPEEEAAA